LQHRVPTERITVEKKKIHRKTFTFFFSSSRATRRYTNRKEFEKQSGQVIGVSEAHAHRHGGRVDRGLGHGHRLNDRNDDAEIRRK
jgi:hypothetical protein